MRKHYSNKLSVLFSFIILFQCLSIPGWASLYQLEIKLEKGALSVEINDAPLLEVLKQLQQVSGIKFTYKNLPTLKINRRFKELPLENGIKEILPVNTIFLYSNPPASMDSSQDQKIVSVIVLPILNSGIEINSKTENPPSSQFKTPTSLPPSSKKSDAAQFEHARYQEGVGTLLLQIEGSMSAYDWIKLLKNQQPKKRLEAVNGLGKLGTDFSVRALYMALGDHDEEVKRAAALNLKQISERKYFQSIKKDLNESNSVIQRQALDLIGQKSGKQWEDLLKIEIKSNRFKGPLKQKAESLLKSLKVKNGDL